MTRHISLSIVLLCVAVLLLSACGLPELIPPVHPWVSADSFILLEDQPGGPPRQVGVGDLTGHSNRVTAVLSLTEPSCLANTPLALTGSVSGAAHPILTLASKPGQLHPIALTAQLPPQRSVYFLEALPFDAVVIVKDSCSPGLILHLKARRSPQPKP